MKRMGNCTSIDRLVVALALGLAAGGVRPEPATLADLARAYEASRAMDRGEAGANLYRAGRFDGYLLAVAESLAARGEVCLPACFCAVREKIDARLETHLGSPASDLGEAAAGWIAARLREYFPCGAR